MSPVASALLEEAGFGPPTGKRAWLKGLGHPLEEERDQLSDSGVVPGCEMARLPGA